MNSQYLIVPIKNVKELINHILENRQLVLGHLALAMDVELQDLEAIYHDDNRAHKNIMRKLCFYFSEVCLEQNGY